MIGEDARPLMNRKKGCEIILFHSVLGVRRGLLQWADRLRSFGHNVHTPDLYDGEVFDDLQVASQKFESLGIPELVRRAQTVVANLPSDLVYAGFSNGGALAELLGATRKGARATILMHAALSLPSLGLDTWPAGVPVQVHYGDQDPWRNEKELASLAASVRKAGALFSLHEYATPGHLFAEPGVPDYDAKASEVMFNAVLDFLGHLSRESELA